MSTFDPTKIRPADGWCVVIAEPRKEKAGLIYKPGHETGAEKVCEGAGRIVRAGKGPKNEAMGLEDGARVMFRGFLKYANPVPVDERWPDGAEKQVFVMSSSDILAVIPEDMEVGAFSGRPQVPEKR